MGFISNIKNMFSGTTEQAVIKMITEEDGEFYSFGGNLYKSDLIRACIRPKAKAVGKLTPKHIRNNRDEGYKINPEPYIRFLLEEPNVYTTFQVMLEKVTTQLMLNNNAFIKIIRDEFGFIDELVPINATLAEAVVDRQNVLYIRFTYANGKRDVIRYSDIIHLRQDVKDSNLFGEEPHKVLLPLMDIISTTDQGIVKAIKNSGVIKWLLKFNQSLRPEDLKKQTQDFNDTFLNINNNNGGAAATDAKFDAKQVEPKDYVPNALLTEKTVQRLFSYYNTNDKIVQSRYNEDEWNAYYESEIEPLAMQLANEFTRKFFSRKERGHGNKIVFSASSLQYASMSTKLNLVQMVDRGAMTPNEWRLILGLEEIEGGDKPIRRLDTAVITTTTEGGED